MIRKNQKYQVIGPCLLLYHIYDAHLTSFSVNRRVSFHGTLPYIFNLKLQTKYEVLKYKNLFIDFHSFPSLAPFSMGDIFWQAKNPPKSVEKIYSIFDYLPP